MDKYSKEAKKTLPPNEIINDVFYMYENCSFEDPGVILGNIVDLFDQCEVENKDVFEKNLLKDIDKNLVFQGDIIESYSTLLKKDSYEKLFSILDNEDTKLSTKAKVIKCLAIVLKQLFDRNLPTDIYKWKEEDLRINEVNDWRNEGCPDGEGYKIPEQDPALFSPQTKLETYASKFEEKLKKSRSKDLCNLDNILIKADPKKLNIVLSKYKLNGDYLEFMTRFSPLNVWFSKSYMSTMVYGVDDILDFQKGYSVNEQGKQLEGWSNNYLVIADMESDPYCLDLSEENGPVYFAYHGEGEWDFQPKYKSFGAFLSYLSK